MYKQNNTYQNKYTVCCFDVFVRKERIISFTHWADTLTQQQTVMGSGI